MPVVISEFGQNHTADTSALHLQRASDVIVVSLPLTVSECSYFLRQNTGIEHGSVEGVPIKLKVLGLGNGITV